MIMTDKKKESSEGDFIGLDYGSSRIGVARINSFAKISEPLDPISTNDNHTEQIQGVIDSFEAVGVVVGLPRGLGGQNTEQTNLAREFAEKLSKNIAVPVYLIDEAGTSVQAQDDIANYKSDSIDSVSAAIFLEDFIGVNNKEDLRVS